MVTSFRRAERIKLGDRYKSDADILLVIGPALGRRIGSSVAAGFSTWPHAALFMISGTFRSNC
jgi:hypothetical protein